MNNTLISNNISANIIIIKAITFARHIKYLGICDTNKASNDVALIIKIIAIVAMIIELNICIINNDSLKYCSWNISGFNKYDSWL